MFATHRAARRQPAVRLSGFCSHYLHGRESPSGPMLAVRGIGLPIVRITWRDREPGEMWRGRVKMGQQVRQAMPFSAKRGFVHAVARCVEPRKKLGWGLTTEIRQRNRGVVFQRDLLRSLIKPCLMCPAFSPIPHKAPRTFSHSSDKPCFSVLSVSSIRAASRAS